MKTTSSFTFFYGSVLILLLIINPLQAQQKQKTVTTEDMGQWVRINWNSSFTENGNWMFYQTISNDNDKTIFLVNTSSNDIQEIKNGDKPEFSANSRWLAYVKVLPGLELKKQQEKKVKNKKLPKLGLIDLSDKDTVEFADVVNFKFSGDGNYIAMKREKDKVNTLIIRNLQDESVVTFGNVADYSWQDKGNLIALFIKTPDDVGNAIQLYNPKNGSLNVLDQKDVIYKNLQWRKKSSDLVVYRTQKDTLYADDSFDLLYWKALESGINRLEFVADRFGNFPDNRRIVTKGLQLAEDGSTVFFSTTFRANKAKDKKSSEIAEVEIWNSKDVEIIPQQKKNTNYGLELAAWNVNSNSYYPIENELVENVQVQVETTLSLGRDQTPYDFEVMFGRPSYDCYIVNTQTGEQTKLVEKVSRGWSVSPDNQYFVYLKEDHLHLFNISTNTSENITSGIEDRFIDVENDHPMAQKPAFGFAGWSADGSSYFINAEFDVWQFYTNSSSPKKLSNGAEEGIIYRYQNFDREKRTIDTAKPLYFRMFGKFTKASGMAVKHPDKAMKTLIYEEKSIGSFAKAKAADNLMFIEQSYRDSPDVFLTNTAFKKPKQVSNTNAFQKDFAWGKATLINYTNALGKPAQGILYYPANYKKGQKYPMITYIYEKLSNRYNSYVSPSERSYYNTTVWTQNGYFVLNPDIEFIAGDPGVSSAKTLESAVKAVVELGDVDADKVGLIGHSWGGYQAGFVPTQTDIFAASVAGAGLTELISMNLAVTPAFGGAPENAHFEVSQERMEVAPWKDAERYLRNSSVMQVENLNTPILFEVGDNDQNVNWFQGIAYYNAARRAAKPFVLLVYAKEGHGLRTEKNQKDYQIRILKWFGHYLKGEKAEEWMKGSVPYAKQQRELKVVKD